MRIAFFVEKFPALSETFILNQITGLIDHGHTVDIYADIPVSESKSHLDIEKYDLLSHTYYSPQMPSHLFWRILKGFGLLLANFFKDPVLLLRSLNFFKYGVKAASLRILYATIPFLGRRPQYDIIQCHFGKNGLKGVFLRDVGALKGKVITTFHGLDLSGFIHDVGDRIYDPLFKKGDLFLSISHYWKHRLVQLGCNPAEIIVHRMGIDCRRFTFTPRRLNADGRIQLITIARLVEKKGVEYGIRAVAKLAKDHRNLEYMIVGDGYLREPLEQLIQELEVADIVKLVGWKQQAEIIQLLSHADILLAPSVTSRKNGDQEGIPVVLMEAMAMGLPVLSTQHSGIPELVEDGVSGFLVPEQDVTALAEKLALLIKYPERWPEMGKAGRLQVENHFEIHQLNDQLIQIYEQRLIEDQKTVWTDRLRFYP
ncbi:MAG: glycosyltransferase [Pseudanabaenales cyanobacterium]|nr:glycosyltransferase [Pseudanabaenales cyanobacterium]